MSDDTLSFSESVSCLLEPALDGLAAGLRRIDGLTAPEHAVFRSGTAGVLYESALRKVSRLLILELNAARVSGRLSAPTTEERWTEFVQMSARLPFWEALGEHYPTLMPRMHAVVANRCGAALSLARRFAADRAALSALTGGPVGEVTKVAFGAGDSHHAGHTVAILTCTGGRVVYKPRSVRVDATLAGLLSELLADQPETTRIRVPAVVAGDGYGWAAYTEHRYCADDTELAAFYRGMGYWLAVMRLLSGNDLHMENVIACGPVPVVVDCETLFGPVLPARPSGYGQAADAAAALVDATVLRTGLLPGRGIGLGWRRVDPSGAGALPGQQPTIEQPVVVGAGTDTARVAMRRFEMSLADNHPSPDPVLSQHWDKVLAGFDEVTEHCLELDRTGRLAPLLEPFGDCPVRVVLRATEVYAEVARMLWHPVSLHDPGAATERAAHLLTSMAATAPGAPDDPVVVAAEVEDLLHGDVPFFDTTPRRGRLTGPGGTGWLAPTDLLDDALRRWRSASLELERDVIQSAIVSAYLNEGMQPQPDPMRTPTVRADDLDRRRRALAAGIVRKLVATAVRAPDGTATWVAPVLNATGWAVQPLSPDLYGGLPGAALLLAAYRRETAAGRAEEVAGIDALLDEVLNSIRMADRRRNDLLAGEVEMRPATPGGYVGIGSQILSWLLLSDWQVPLRGPAALDRAVALAGQVPASVEADDEFDVLMGSAGVIVPLLGLAERTGERRFTDLAVVAGERLLAAARRTGETACWPTIDWPEGIGGFAHGATGIGWALARLARATGEGRFGETAAAAFAFEETAAYDAAAGGWRDLRDPEFTASAWCHGAVGIGLAAADLPDHGSPERRRSVLRRAVAAAWARGLDWNHTMCHGDLCCWELFEAGFAEGLGPPGASRTSVRARILSSLEHHGPVTGMARDAFTPGLFPGVGGMAYQLLRMHPECDLPSVLVPLAHRPDPR